MRFVIFVIDDATNMGTGSEMSAIDAFNDELRANGHWVFACGIGSPSTATLVDNRDDLGHSIAQSLFEGVDFYSGFWIIDASNPEHANRLALAASRACNRRVELRPLL